jgi:hypothetical protein
MAITESALLDTVGRFRLEDLDPGRRCLTRRAVVHQCSSVIAVKAASDGATPSLHLVVPRVMV